MRDLDSLGPVCNPDGSPSDVTKAMLAGTGRDPVAFARSVPSSRDWISTADTAKIIRTVLRDHFPGVRFSVRSKVYSGGSSITIRYTDGPRVSDVRGYVDGFAGRDFDPMIDLGIYVDAVLDARGRVVGRRGPGTVGSHGILPAIDDPIPPGGRVVHFGVSYVFVDQLISKPVMDRADAILRARGYDPSGWDVPRYVRDQAIDAALAGAPA